MAAVERESLLRFLGPQRSLFEPLVRPAGDAPAPEMSLLVAAVPRPDPRFLQRHPYARELLEPMPLETSIDTLEGLVALLQNYPGVNVVVDHRALEEAGYYPPDPAHPKAAKRAAARDEEDSFGGSKSQTAVATNHHGSNWPLIGKGRMSLRSFAKFFLRQEGLALVEEPHMLRITTTESAEQLVTTEVYPLADLLAANQAPDPQQLSNPYLDCELSARQRIKAKLQRPMSVDFKNEPLRAVVKHFAAVLDDTVLLDCRALKEAGIGFDTPVTASWRNVPAKESLQEILHQSRLDYVFRNEALVITTREAAEQLLTVRLHSGIGVVSEWPMPAWQESSGAGGAPFVVSVVPSGFGGMGGMGGGFGGGMGGGGFFGGAGGGGGGASADASFGGRHGTGGGMGTPGSGISSGGDPSLEDETAEADAQLTPWPGAGAPGAAPGIGISGPGRMQYDHDGIGEMVHSTIQPTTWDEVGGPGNIAFFTPTLDFVCAATEEVHDQIDALFDSLRQLPSELAAAGSVRPAKAAPIDQDFSGDFDSPIDLIHSTVSPTTWDEVGGPGSIAPDRSHLALIVSQTEDVHEGVSALLTLLRRSRYAAFHKEHPWELARGIGDGASTTPLLDMAAGAEPAFAPRQAWSRRRTRMRWPRWACGTSRPMAPGNGGGATPEAMSKRRSRCGSPAGGWNSGFPRVCCGPRARRRPSPIRGWPWSSWATSARRSGKRPMPGSPGCRTAATRNSPAASRSRRSMPKSSRPAPTRSNCGWCLRVFPTPPARI